MTQRYFEFVTDLSLRSRAAYEYARLGLPLPAELAQANRDWQLLQGRKIITLDDSNKRYKKQESQYMSHLVSDLLLLSRLDAGKIRLNLQPVLASEAPAQARHDAARLAAQKNVSVQVAGTYDGLMMADPERIQQVLMAILDNAIRHTPADGQITLEAHQHGNKIALVVTDTGEGIPPQKLPYVFERFYQADAARTQGSAGLGLSIARTLIEAMRGSIQLSSAPGRGTQVTLLLPCASSRQRS